MEIHFILYRPAVPGNVGAAARALKTMGFSHLRLIGPCDHLSEEARMFAHGSLDILENALVFESFREAAAGLDLIVCTSARERTAKHDYHSSRDLRGLLEAKGPDLGCVGILFGTEESGLPNELVLESDLAVSIPMPGSYPSLNLAQAVMVIAYELSPLNELKKPGKVISKSGEGWGEMKRLAGEVLAEAGIQRGTPLYHRIMERLSTAGSADIPLFLSVLSRIAGRD
jgi:tRNA/rRNA methyltransferase